MRRILILFLTLAALLPAQTRNLDIYWIDVEGGASTLIVTPSGQSLLVDTGFPSQTDRDAKRIAEAAQAAGLAKIDMLVITHYHADHIGGVPALAKLIPIEHFYDHGDSVEPSAQYEAYKALAQGKRTILKPGDKIPLNGMDVTVVSAAGEVIGKAINGGGPNALCNGAEQKPTDTTENSQSTGFLLTYGKFKFLDVGDLTWDREMKLACPDNKVGTVTLFQATHHGFSNGMSGNPALIWAMKPQVVIVNNGARKGFSNGGYETISKIPGIEGIWQGHRGAMNDAAHNTSEDMIANIEDGPPGDQGKWIKASISSDGKFTVTNSRNNFSKTYASR